LTTTIEHDEISYAPQQPGESASAHLNGRHVQAEGEQESSREDRHRAESLPASSAVRSSETQRPPSSRGGSHRAIADIANGFDRHSVWCK